MIVNQKEYDLLSAGSHKYVQLVCDSGKNEKCLGTFLREKRIAEKQRTRTDNKDYCKFCQKTEEFSGRGNPNTKYFFDDNLLSNIDTAEKAYLLGWIASDGSISKNTISINIRDYDINILKQLRNFIDPCLPITERSNNMVELSINSSKLASDCLKHLGLEKYGKKDCLVKYPNIPEELNSYFIRGFFDGDGSVYIKNMVPGVNISSNSLDMLNSIKNKTGLGSVYNTSSGPKWQTTSGKDALAFLKYIYDDVTVPSLDRKFDKYVKLESWKPSILGNNSAIKFNTTQGLIKFNKSRADAILPKITDIHASGIDLHIIEKVKDFTEDVSLYTTGIKVQPPEGYYFILVGRSSISKSGYSLANAIGIIDENYVGEILVPLRKHTDEKLELPNRLVQLVLVPKINCDYVIVDSLEDTDRGDGGFGSTGK